MLTRRITDTIFEYATEEEKSRLQELEKKILFFDPRTRIGKKTHICAIERLRTFQVDLRNHLVNKKKSYNWRTIKRFNDFKEWTLTRQFPKNVEEVCIAVADYGILSISILDRNLFEIK